MMHSPAIHGVLERTNTALGLRCGNILLDSTKGYFSSTSSHMLSISSVLKFFNSELYFTSKESAHLLRNLQPNPLDRRDGYFNEIRSVRRRKQTISALAVPHFNAVFNLPDYFSLLEFRAIISSMRARITRKGMKLLDFFRCCDSDNDGRLNCSELYGGILWLGLTSVTENDIYAIMKHMDKYQQGYITFDLFAHALGDYRRTTDLNTATTTTVSTSQVVTSTKPVIHPALLALASTILSPVYYISLQDIPTADFRIPPRYMRELYITDSESVTKIEEVSLSALQRLTIKLKKVSSFHLIWSSVAVISGGARKNLSIWSGQFSTSVFARNKVSVPIGQYVVNATGEKKAGGKNFKAPSNLVGFTVEVTDLDTSSLFRSALLSVACLNYFVPHPINYKLQWFSVVVPNKLQHIREETNFGATPFMPTATISVLDKEKDKDKDSPFSGNGLYIWKPIPPSPHFVTLGMIATTTADPPSLTSIRCVPKGWCRTVTTPPQLYWDDSGLAGKKGSIWLVGKYQLLWATEGHNAPEGPFYELNCTEKDHIIAGEKFIPFHNNPNNSNNTASGNNNSTNTNNNS